jgi:hypothetical protein
VLSRAPAQRRSLERRVLRVGPPIAFPSRARSTQCPCDHAWSARSTDGEIGTTDAEVRSPPRHAAAIDRYAIFNPQTCYISIKAPKNVGFVSVGKKKVRIIEMMPETRVRERVKSHSCPPDIRGTKGRGAGGATHLRTTALPARHTRNEYAMQDTGRDPVDRMDDLELRGPRPATPGPPKPGVPDCDLQLAGDRRRPVLQEVTLACGDAGAERDADPGDFARHLHAGDRRQYL